MIPPKLPQKPTNQSVPPRPPVPNKTTQSVTQSASENTTAQSGQVAQEIPTIPTAPVQDAGAKQNSVEQKNEQQKEKSLTKPDERQVYVSQIKSNVQGKPKKVKTLQDPKVRNLVFILGESFCFVILGVLIYFYIVYKF